MRRARTILLITALVAAALTQSNLAAGAEPICQTDLPVEGDVDGDGLADLVVGLPSRNSAAGEVDLRLTRAQSRILTPAAADLGLGAPGDRFGAAIALADLDEDGCDDLIVGAPGADQGTGRVFVVRGDDDGFQLSGAQVLIGGATLGSAFGSAIAVAHNWDRTGYDLWLGAPSADVDDVPNTGAVVHYTAAVSDGALVVDEIETISQNSPGVPGADEANDHFGAVLSATRQGVLVASGPEPGDHFGAAVHAFEGVSVVGVPGEDVGTARDAGMVQLFGNGGLDDPAPIPRASYDQDSPGVPGVVEAGDRLGSAVALARNLCFDDTLQAAAGAPGEDVTIDRRPRADAGTVLVVTASSFGSCRPRAVDQNTVLDGVPEAGDHLGAMLAPGRHSEDDPDAADRVFIGVPQEDHGTVTDAGIVQATPKGSGADSTAITVAHAKLLSVGYSGGAVTGTAYGTVIASPAGD